MMTMSDDGEKACPLCAEDMDLTDQQLKPCKCGYEICVWCWHHIMEMAEKEGSEGRCPACRTRYNKARIVGMAANCERVVAELSLDKKHKGQRAKPKAPWEDRKHLDGVRVIKRNLVYIIGWPANLSDESILERREYFGQYGKVLKVSISHPANTTSAIQQTAANNNTLRLYITYAKEEEAVRCIQAVNSFVLEGKPLRANFGTTKYCHLWLRNMSCTNPDCLYLHDVGSQEDSFTKDEIISADTRGKVPQSASNNLQRRTGQFLPPPVDDLYDNGTASGKHVLKNAPSNPSVQVIGYNNVSTGGKSAALPAASSWGSCVSNCRPPVASTASSQNSVKQKVDNVNSSSSLSSLVANTNQTSTWPDDATISSKMPEERHTVRASNKSGPIETTKPSICKGSQITVSDMSSEPLFDGAHDSRTSAWDDDNTTFKMHDGMHSKGSSRSVITSRSSIVRDNPTYPGVSMDSTVDNACKSSWDDDEVTISQISQRMESINMDMDDTPNFSDTTSPNLVRNLPTSVSDISPKIVVDASLSTETSLRCSSSTSAPVTECRDGGIAVLGDNTSFLNTICPDGSERRFSNSIPDEGFNGLMVDAKTEKLCSGLASACLDDHLEINHPSMDQNESAVPAGMRRDIGSSLQKNCPVHGIECLAAASIVKTSTNTVAHVSRGLSDWNSDLQLHDLVCSATVFDDSLLDSSANNHRVSHTSNQPPCLANEHGPLDISNCSSNTFWNSRAGDTLLSAYESSTLDAEVDTRQSSFRENGPALFNAQKEKLGHLDIKKEGSFLARSDDISNIGKTASVAMGESSIITDMLSLDFDPWDDSLSSPKGFAKLLGDVDKQDGSSKLSSSLKFQRTNQSRFSFARQENLSDNVDTYARNTGDRHTLSSLEDTSAGDFSHFSQSNGFDGSIGLLNSKSVASSDTSAGVSRGKISTPPGFSIPNRAPPPGFSSHDKYGHSYETCSENRLLDHSSLRNQYQDHSAGNASDVEFIDPAILSVGKGVLPLGVNNSGFGSRYAFPTQLNTSDNDSRLHTLRQQQSIAARKDRRIQEHAGDIFLPSNDAYISSFLAQSHKQSMFAQMTQQPRASHLLGSPLDGWNNTMVNDMHMAEMLRNDRIGVNYYPVNEENKFHRTTSGDIYSRAFGM